MPIYEYECDACGHHLESLQKVNDKPLRLCPECGKPALRKLMSAVGFRLKGGGWYETDFKSDKKRNLVDSGGEKPAQETKEKKSAEKKVTEPAGKSEKKKTGTKQAAKAASE